MNASTSTAAGKEYDDSVNSDALVSGDAGVTSDNQENAAERRAKGEFVRGLSTARKWIKDGGDYTPEEGRYHLYVGYNCPWCHRVLIGRVLAGLQQAITVDVCFPNRSSDEEPLGPNLWKFLPEGQVGANGSHVKFDSCTIDTVHGKIYVKEIYELAGIHDQKSVPVLFDKKTNTVVSNESAEILRMFGTSMRHLGTQSSPSKDSIVELYPEKYAKEIDEINDWVYKEILNGAYKAGFSSSQDTYERAYEAFFAALDKVEALLVNRDFLVGAIVTEADVRLFPTLFRLDPVYHLRFKLNKSYLWEYPKIWSWMGRMMALEGMEPVSNQEYLSHCKQGYFGRTGNGTVPVGPEGYPECYKKPHCLGGN